jgi:hypothetical protein
VLEARYLAAVKQWEKAVETYRTLFRFFPDNLDYGLGLVGAQVEAGHVDNGKTTIAALRILPAPMRDDPRIDLTELGVAIGAPIINTSLLWQNRRNARAKRQDIAC